MSRIVWKNVVTPDLTTSPIDLNDEYYRIAIDRIRPYPVADKDIGIPDPKAFRSMSRASLLISHVCQSAQEFMKEALEKSRYAVGVYCAVENGPIDAASTSKIIAQDPSQFANFYKKFRNPKMYLKQLPNVVPAQMGISLGLQGPMNVYTHSTAGSLHALEQAEWDLKTETVAMALVCTAHAFDDFLVVKRVREADPRIINEGAAACLLVANGEFTDWSQKVSTDQKEFFGISDPIINYLKGEKDVTG